MGLFITQQSNQKIRYIIFGLTNQLSINCNNLEQLVVYLLSKIDWISWGPLQSFNLTGNMLHQLITWTLSPDVSLSSDRSSCESISQVVFPSGVHSCCCCCGLARPVHQLPQWHIFTGLPHLPRFLIFVYMSFVNPETPSVGCYSINCRVSCVWPPFMLVQPFSEVIYLIRSESMFTEWHYAAFF